MYGSVGMVKKEDLPEILQVQKAAFTPVAQSSGNFNIVPMTETIEQLTDDYERMAVFKYTLDGNIVGSVRACPNESNDCYIGRLSVHPDYQGRGIGQALMSAVHDAYQNCRGFILFTAKDSEKNISFYKKLGYYIVSVQNKFGIEMVFMRCDNL